MGHALPMSLTPTERFTCLIRYSERPQMGHAVSADETMLSVIQQVPDVSQTGIQRGKLPLYVAVRCRAFPAHLLRYPKPNARLIGHPAYCAQVAPLPGYREVLYDR